MMNLTPEEVEAIASAVTRRMCDNSAFIEVLALKLAAHITGEGISPVARPPQDVSLLAKQALQQYYQKRAEEQRLDGAIREEMQKMPPDLRPVPEQYKSIPRKKHVLELVKDPTRWEDVPPLSKQWPGTPRKKRKNGDV